MRLVPLALPTTLALVAALAYPAAAQSDYTDEEGAYLSFDEFSLRWADGLAGAEVSGQAGWRFGNGFDVGLKAEYGAYGYGQSTYDASGWSIGATAGYAYRPSPRTVARVAGEVTYGRSGQTPGEVVVQDPLSYRITWLGAGAQATLGRDVPLVGSVGVRPTVGAHAAARQSLVREVQGFDLSPGSDQVRIGVGLHLEMPVTFRLFGTDAALVPGYRLPLGGTGLGVESGPSLGLRVNF